ncbi:MAG: DUF5659 domain-containing protein [Candidatus Zixiibacteriota bacterium]
MPLERIFVTPDIALSAVLKIEDFKLIRINRDSGKTFFVFEDKPDRSEVVMRFVNREILVEPLRFMEEIRNLKSLTRQ